MMIPSAPSETGIVLEAGIGQHTVCGTTTRCLPILTKPTESRVIIAGRLYMIQIHRPNQVIGSRIHLYLQLRGSTTALRRWPVS